LQFRFVPVSYGSFPNIWIILFLPSLLVESGGPSLLEFFHEKPYRVCRLGKYQQDEE
jgi:hypothetical protein